MQPQKKAYILAIIVVLFWSTMGSAFALTLRHISFTDLVLYTSLVSFIFLSAMMIQTGEWKQVRTTPIRLWGMSALMGLLNPFGYYLILFYAYSKIRAQEAVALNYTWPLVLVLLSIPVLHQKIGWKNLLAISISFIGALLVVSRGDLRLLSVEHPVGSLMALCSALLWAAFWLMNLKDKRQEVSKLWMNFLFGTGYTAVFVALFTQPQWPGWQASVGCVYIGILEMGLTFLLWLTALRLSSTTAKITPLVYLSPFFSMILIHFLVGESIDRFTWGGLVFIIGGILLETRIRKRKAVV